MEHSEDLALEDHGRSEDSRVTVHVERSEVEQWRLGEHDEAPLPHHPADDAVARGDRSAFHRLR